VSIEQTEKRREPRHPTNNAITFCHINKEEHYIGIARNISRSGMYFCTRRELKPGNCIVILPLDCHATDLLWGDGEHGEVAESYCAVENRADENLRYFVNMVTAQVTRCEALPPGDRLRFGVAVDYLRPTL
jgi:hypothetical protein